MQQQIEDQNYKLKWETESRSLTETTVNQDPQNHGFLLNKTHPMSQMFQDIVNDKNNNFVCKDLEDTKM